MIYPLENDRLAVKINSLGAELWSLVDKSDGAEHLWQGDAAFWGRRAPTLFPFCGRLKDDRYLLGDRTFQATQHGFARDCEHRLVGQKDRSIRFSLSDSGETLEKYPFRFRLFTGYELEENRLTCSLQVENPGPAELPFSIGFHTGYLCPFDSAHSIRDYSVVFEQKETADEILCDGNGLLSGEKARFLDGRDAMPLSDETFPHSFILENPKSRWIALRENGSGRAVRVHLSDFPYVALWSTPHRVPFLCVEPWHGLPDRADTDGQFLRKPGLRKIGAGQTFRCSQTIEIVG